MPPSSIVGKGLPTYFARLGESRLSEDRLGRLHYRGIPPESAPKGLKVVPLGSDPEDAQRIGGDAPMIGSTVASRKREPCSALRRSCSTLRRPSPVKGEGI